MQASTKCEEAVDVERVIGNCQEVGVENLNQVLGAPMYSNQALIGAMGGK